MVEQDTEKTAVNPHYVTPEEADRMTCVVNPAEHFCNGPDCMAWRWKPEGTQNLRQGYELRIPLHPEQPMTHGYCGMVRA